MPTKSLTILARGTTPRSRFSGTLTVPVVAHECRVRVVSSPARDNMKETFMMAPNSNPRGQGKGARELSKADRVDYYAKMVSLIQSSFDFSDADILKIMTMTKVKLAANALRFTYACLGKYAGDLNLALGNLRRGSLTLQNQAWGQQATKAMTALSDFDQALVQLGLPQASFFMPSLNLIERVQVVHSAPLILESFPEVFVKKYNAEFTDFNNESKGKLGCAVSAIFPSHEAKAVSDYLAKFTPDEREVLLRYCERAKPYAETFTTLSLKDLLATTVGPLPTLHGDLPLNPDRDTGAQLIDYYAVLSRAKSET